MFVIYIICLKKKNKNNNIDHAIGETHLEYCL